MSWTTAAVPRPTRPHQPLCCVYASVCMCAVWLCPVCCVVCKEAVCLAVKCNRVWLNTARDEMRVQICLVNCQQLGVLLANTCLLGSLHKTHWPDLPGKSQFSHRSLCWWISTIFAWHCNNGHLWISDRTMLIFADGNVCNILAISRLIFCELLWRQSFRIEEGHNISRPDHDMRLDHARERDDPRGWFTLFTFSSGIKKWWQKLCLDSALEREMAHENAIHIVSFLFPDACQPSTTLRTKHSCLYRSKKLKKDKIEYFSLLWIQIWIFQWLC